MKFCWNCGYMTAGEPLFCGSCGRSYDVKLCPRLHANPRRAEVCSQCGSRDLSLPQPKVPLLARVLLGLTKYLLGAVILAAAVFLVGLALYIALRQPEVQEALVLIVLLLLILLFLWTRIPESVRRFIQRWLKRKENHAELR